MSTRLHFWMRPVHDEAAPAPAAPAPAAEAAPEAAPAESKTFTQDEINSLLATERRGFQEKIQKATEELKAAQQKFNLTAAEKEDLAQQVERLNNTFKSQQQIESEKREKEASENALKLKEKTESSQKWQKAYEDLLIENTITSAAAKFEAISADQIIELKRASVTLINEVVDGKTTDRMIPVMKIKVSDNKGNPVELELPVADAIEKMSQSREYANLFKNKGTGGLGMNNNAGNPKPLNRDSLKGMSMEEYKANRSQIFKES